MSHRKAIEIRDVSLEATRMLATRLRAQDEAEVWLTCLKPPSVALVESVATSLHTFLGCIDGNPEAVFGLSEVAPGGSVGIPWMVGSDALARDARSWLALAQGWVDWMQSEYPVLTNVVHNKNTKAIRWLKRLGFSFLPNEVPEYPGFIQFVRYRTCVDH